MRSVCVCVCVRERERERKLNFDKHLRGTINRNCLNESTRTQINLKSSGRIRLFSRVCLRRCSTVMSLCQ